VEGTLLRVDGRLDAESVSELEDSCEEAVSPLTLDIQGLQWVDDQAAAYLKQLMAAGAVVTNASPYVALRVLVKQPGSSQRAADTEIDDAGSTAEQPRSRRRS